MELLIGLASGFVLGIFTASWVSITIMRSGLKRTIQNIEEVTE